MVRRGFNFFKNVIIVYMARISYWQVPPEWKDLLEKIIIWNNRYGFVSVRRKSLFTSVKRKKNLTLKSVIPLASEQWALLTPAEKDAWASAGQKSNQKSFQLFVRDIAARLKNGLPYPGTPSDIVQYNVGRVMITFPAAGFLIRQEHPYKNWVMRKVRGTRDQYEPIELEESFALPLEISISHRTDLTSTGANSIARFYVEVTSHYQGREIVSTFSIDFGLQDSWRNDSLVIDKVPGFVKSYTLYIDIQNAEGVMDWDNVRAVHSGVNWARDSRCDNVGVSFTGSFFFVARHWESLILPPGAFYDSIYYNL